MMARVLIADSDTNLAETYRNHLVRSGYVAAVASDALECVRALRETSPDVLVLGTPVFWGRYDGILAMMRQEADLRPPLVMVLASDGDYKAVRRAASREAIDYQHKPLSPGQLEERVRRMLEQYPDDVSPTKAK